MRPVSSRGANVNARGAWSCDQAVRPEHVRRVGNGDEELKAEESVGEHDVEMQGGPHEETIDMGGMTMNRTSRRITRRASARSGMHDPDAPVEKEVREHHCSGICRSGAGVTIAYGDVDESVTINEREIKKDWEFKEYNMEFCFLGDEFEKADFVGGD